jgi:hypothetical protein
MTTGATNRGYINSERDILNERRGDWDPGVRRDVGADENEAGEHGGTTKCEPRSARPSLVRLCGSRAVIAARFDSEQ